MRLYCTLLVLCWLEIMDCCVEGYLTNFFAHCTMIMKEMDEDSTLCFFLKTWVPCAHLLDRRLKNLLPTYRPWLILQNLRWYFFFRCLCKFHPLNLELPCKILAQRGESSFSAFGSSFLMNIMIFLGDIPVYLVMVTVFCDLLISHESNSAARKRKRNN